MKGRLYPRLFWALVEEQRIQCKVNIYGKAITYFWLFLLTLTDCTQLWSYRGFFLRRVFSHPMLSPWAITSPPLNLTLFHFQSLLLPDLSLSCLLCLFLLFNLSTSYLFFFFLFWLFLNCFFLKEAFLTLLLTGLDSHCPCRRHWITLCCMSISSTGWSVLKAETEGSSFPVISTIPSALPAQ